jgi:hypothetical protein
VYLAPLQVDVPSENRSVTFFANLTPVYYPLLWADRYGAAR